MSFIYSTQENIKDVYSENMIDELRKISDLIEEFNYLSMDTEFPGIVYPNTQQMSSNVYCNFSNSSLFNSFNQVPLISPKNPTKAPNPKNTNETLSNSCYDFNYKNIKSNVDDLKMIQFGITLSDKYGNHPEETATWQFNFKFDLDTDIYLHESIQLLEFAGIDFNKFYHEGIDQEYFAENVIASGVVLNENVKWITFHGAYDFAYFLKTISNQSLPDNEQTFMEYLFIYFPKFYDLRYMIKNITWLKGSLSRIASDLDIKWNGSIHQAGCDSMLTSKVFTKLCSNYGEYLTMEQDLNMLFGFNSYITEDTENNQTEIKLDSIQCNTIYHNNNTFYNNYKKLQLNPPIRPNNSIVYNPYVNINYNMNSQTSSVLYPTSNTSLGAFNNYGNFDYGSNFYSGNMSSYIPSNIRK